jgi:[acyl-carrier-protein] S-malonyltransferase
VTLALLFPGQGSQVVGMGRDLAHAHPEAAAVLQEADDTLGFALSSLMADGPEDRLTETRHAQPAILAHSVGVLRVVSQRLGPVAMAAGHSLGEFSAHVAAGTLSFAEALSAVLLRGELMYAAGQTRPGAMAAILGLDDAVLDGVCSRVDEGTCVPANYNTPGQIVISGDVAGVEQGMALADEAGAKRVLRLNVSGAFHSPLMAPAAEGLRQRLAEIDFADPAFPVFSNVTASPVRKGDDARDLLVQQLTAPVRWATSIDNMVRAGADRFVELGPGSVLCGLNRRNARGAPCASLGTPGDIERYGADA